MTYELQINLTREEFSSIKNFFESRTKHINSIEESCGSTIKVIDDLKLKLLKGESENLKFSK